MLLTGTGAVLLAARRWGAAGGEGLGFLV